MSRSPEEWWHWSPMRSDPLSLLTHVRSGCVLPPLPVGRIVVQPLDEVLDRQVQPINVDPRLRIKVKEEGRTLCLLLQAVFIPFHGGSWQVRLAALGRYCCQAGGQPC
ncbi:unnamed protein product [Coccothraustes coccothraustes]